MPTLDWIGKKAVVNHHRDVPYRLLHCDKAKSVGDPDAGNLLVQGDNLEALKALLPYYAGKVKCIYIDPPYNTGNESWVYNDNVNSPEIQTWLGDVVGKEAEDLSRHDKWLCMMYPRLRLLKEFLRDDGSIWISIDDNESHSLRMIMDEIFGRERFISSIAWQKRYSRENRTAIGSAHEHIFIYSVNPEAFKESRNKIPLGSKQRSVYGNANNDPRGLWRAVSLSAQGFRPNQMYEITGPSGKVHLPPAGSCWKIIRSEFEKLLADDRVYFGKNGDAVPSRKQFLKDIEGIVPWTWWPHEEAGHTDEAKREVQQLFTVDQAFDTPKPERLMQRIIQIASAPGDIVLDSFLGSGTTSAVAHKLGRRYIGIEMGQHATTHILPRLKKVVEGEKGGISSDVDWNGGGGFRFCFLGEPLFDADGNVNPSVTFPDLAAHVFFCETGSPIPKKADASSPLIGTFQGRAVYVLYAPHSIGIPSDSAGNMLTVKTLESLPLPSPDFTGARVIYAEGCTVPDDRLHSLGVTFKQVPYQIEGL